MWCILCVPTRTNKGGLEMENDLNKRWVNFLWIYTYRYLSRVLNRCLYGLLLLSHPTTFLTQSVTDLCMVRCGTHSLPHSPFFH